MPRLARIVAPGLPHHVTQRGNRRQTTFFGEDGRRPPEVLLVDHKMVRQHRELARKCDPPS